MSVEDRRIGGEVYFQILTLKLCLCEAPCTSIASSVKWDYSSTSGRWHICTPFLPLLPSPTVRMELGSTSAHSKTVPYLPPFSFSWQ